MAAVYVGFSAPTTSFPIFGWIIQAVESRPYDHAYIRFQEPTTGIWIVFEASKEMVNLYSYEVFTGSNKTIKEYKIDATDAQYQDLWLYIIKSLGIPYSLLIAFGILVMKIFPFLKSNPFGDSPNEEICSELASRVCAMLGVQVPSDYSAIDPSALDQLLSNNNIPLSTDYQSCLNLTLGQKIQGEIMKKHIFNLKWQKADPRDHKYLAAPLPAPLPPVYDPRHLDGPIDDQGDLGSCTAFSSGGAFQYLQMQEIRAKMPLNASPEEWSAAFTEVSKLFIYYNERVIEGTVDEDSGGELRDVVKALAQSGVCADSLCPYDVNTFTQKPSAAAYADAANHKITQYAALSSLADIKHALASNFPVVFGINVYESFEGAEAAQTGMIPMPNVDQEQCVGGHAICAIGYDDTKQCLIMRNSWGTSWGDKGYFYLPYAYVQDPNLSSDFWAIKK